MKLRIRGDSVRLRLTRPETEQLGNGEAVSQTTEFAGGGILRTTLAPTTDDRMSAQFDNNVLTVSAPRTALRDWATSNQVTLNCDQHNPPQILVEKDFA
ncbi:MAG: Hsp20/alpha crystallin family protein, partial [Pseudomonadota bacterium]